MQTENEDLVRRWIVQFLEAPTLIDPDLMLPILEAAEAVTRVTTEMLRPLPLDIDIAMAGREN